MQKYLIIKLKKRLKKYIQLLKIVVILKKRSKTMSTAIKPFDQAQLYLKHAAAASLSNIIVFGGLMTEKITRRMPPSLDVG